MVMAVESCTAEAGKVFATAKDSGIAKSAQEFSRITNGLDWIGGNGARTQSALRFLEPQVDTRRKVGVESHRVELPADQFPVIAKQLERSRCGDISDGWNRRNDIAKTIDRAAFHIHAAKHRSRHRLLRITQESMCLCSLRNVAFEKNRAAGIKGAQHRAQMRRNTGAFEAHDEQLADLLAKIEAGFRRHTVTGSVSRSPQDAQCGFGYASVDLPLE